MKKMIMIIIIKKWYGNICGNGRGGASEMKSEVLVGVMSWRWCMI
jgi:hypothetical protein